MIKINDQKVMGKFLTLRTNFILISILLLGAFLRFYKLDWGNGLFAHPDEYHIIISVSGLSFPSQMNPHFFSYGTVIIYLIYFTKVILTFLLSLLNTSYLIPNPFLIGRFYSAFFSTLTILVIYRIGALVWGPRVGLLAATLTALTPGLIQQAHFLTPESTLIFFLFSCLYFCLRFLKSSKFVFLALSSGFLGLGLGVKVSILPTLIIPILTVLLTAKTSVSSSIKKIILILAVTGLTLVIVDPFIFFDFQHFKDNIQYEESLAAGGLDVFYTRQFIATTPFLFQLTKIYPFVLGPAMLEFGLVGILLLLGSRPSRGQSLILGLFCLILIPNGLLFAKWTRFVSPTFPFFALFASYLFSRLPKVKLFIFLNTYYLILIPTFLWTLAVFSIYLRPDIRLTASDWIVANARQGSRFLVEGGNTIDIPLTGNFNRLSLDFYSLDSDLSSRQKVAEALADSDYFVIESRRVFKNHQRLPQLFPKTASFYNNLFAGNLGYREIQEFSSFPQLNFFGFNLIVPDENAEETWSVFDHPVIRIFKKTQNHPAAYYLSLAENGVSKQ